MNIHSGQLIVGSMTFSVVTTGGWALIIFIVPLWKRGFYRPPFEKEGSLIPPLEKGGEGGF
ncbi:MAG TPA: hypothetical protein DIW61_02115 [Candidatus Aminicenantes bacterium]|nr:hypothetical protein [Candidatus Aminicenantes bacterium]